MSKDRIMILISDGVDSQSVFNIEEIIKEASRNQLIIDIVGLNGKNSVKTSPNTRFTTEGYSATLTPYLPLEQISKDFQVGIYKFIILPDGEDEFVEAMCKSALLGKVLKEMENNDQYICALGSSLKVLHAHNIGVGKKIVAIPEIKNQLADKYSIIENSVADVFADGKLISGTVEIFELAIKIVSEHTNKSCSSLAMRMPSKSRRYKRPKVLSN